MLTLRRAEERGRANFGWLDSRHTFSFGHYYDPDHMGFGPLRVINDDRVALGGGFPTPRPQRHGDRHVRPRGSAEHKDSLGTGSVIRPGDVQRMSAGTGIRHSEFNASRSEPVHFLQIWIIPERQAIAPAYEQKTFEAADKRGRLRLVGSRDGREGSVTIHQDVDLYASTLGTGEEVRHTLASGRTGWVQVARVALNGGELAAGDGAALARGDTITLTGIEEAEVLLFDLAAV